jgi:streptogramin lyase
MTRRRPAVVAVAALALTLPASAAASPTITEFSKGLNQGAEPQSILAGPDGDLWFTQPGSSAALDRMTLPGGISAYMAGASPVAVALGPDGKLWFTESGPGAKIGTIEPFSGLVYEYSPPVSGTLTGITGGPEGDLWFDEEAGTETMIGRIVPASAEFTYYKLPSAGMKPLGITAGPEGDLWFTESNGNGAIGKLDPSTKVIVEYTSGLSLKGVPSGITAGPDGNIWFTESAKESKIGRINPQTAHITEFPVSANSLPQNIATSSDGNLYFTQSAGNAIGRITPSGVVSEYNTGLSEKAEPWGITTGPDGNIWFTEKAKPARVGRATVAPSVASPSARAVSMQSETLNALVGANAQATNYFFEYGPTPAYGSYSVNGSAGSAGSPATVSVTLTGLSPGATYYFRAVAYNATGSTYSGQATFTAGAASGETPPAKEAAPAKELAKEAPASAMESSATTPVIGTSTAAQPASGTVLVQQPSGSFVPLSAARTLPIGTVIDATRGTVRLITAIDRHGRTQTVTVWGGVFELNQGNNEDAYTRIVLKGALPTCHRGKAGHASAARAHVKSRKLWAADNHGKYSTYGANSVATVLGTEWETIDSCAGTLTRVVSGQVRVRALHGHKTVLVSAGHSFLARP